jgi:hypothetical protein
MRGLDRSQRAGMAGCLLGRVGPVFGQTAGHQNASRAGGEHHLREGGLQVPLAYYSSIRGVLVFVFIT